MNLRCVLPLLASPIFLVAQEMKLLTENGLTNPKYTEYKDAPHLATGGTVSARPVLAAPKGAPITVPFAESPLTNGDPGFDYKRAPGPYAYWQSMKRGEFEFDLAKPYRIRKVRVCILNSGPHGTARIELYKLGDPLEFPEALKLGELRAENGWNVFDKLDTTVDGLRLRFTAEKGKTYITVSEAEIWGEKAVGKVAARARAPKRANPKSVMENGIEWYAFDFGPVSSPTFSNFTGVTNNVVYAKERGYGFIPYHDGKPDTPSNFGPESTVVPGLAERDRVGSKASYCDGLYRDFVMTARYYHTQVQQTFAIDVPNGTYRVITFHGDQQYGRVGEQSWWIDAEGKRVVEKLDMPPSYAADAVFEASVKDGQLSVTFDAEHPKPASCGFLLNGLAAFPANTPAEKEFAASKIAKIRRAIKRERDDLFDNIFTEVPYVEETEMPKLSATDQERGFLAFVPHWLANIYPNSVPRPEDLTRPVGCYACPGEYEPMAIALRALRELKGVRCIVSDLTGPETMPASAIEVRTVKYWRQRIGSSWGTEWRLMPELLELKAQVDVAKDTTQQFWLTVHVPDGAKPGIYRGTVTLATANAGTLQTPVSVEVLPFTLQPNERPVGMYWYEHKVAGTPRRDAQVRDMLAHGMTTLTMGGLFPEVQNVDGKLALDVAPLQTFLQELKSLGIAGPIPYNTSSLMSKLKRAFPGLTKAAHDALYVEAVRQLETVSSRADTPKLLHYPVDEIGNHDERGEKANHECALVATVPGATSYITVNNYPAGEKWGDTFDIWCGNIEYTAEQETALLAKGKRYMRYGSAYLNDARKARNSCGLGFYRRPAEAMFYWHYQCYQGQPTNDFDGTCRDHCAAYPGEDGIPVPTIDWESLREGVDDMRYIATLKHYAALAARKPQAKGAAASALKTLQTVLGGDDRVNQGSFRDDLGHDEYHALRRQLVDAILELRAALGDG
ncbi:MAG: DUF4091 domain-containing protein [Victivallales bacterium]|nr:DUF4091 domain-containing protein [Victivallales bacterium]